MGCLKSCPLTEILNLGGDNFDEVLIDWMVNKFKEESGIDVSKDSMAIQRLRDAAEKSKIELSSSSSTEINLPYLSAGSEGPKHFVCKLTRSEFERMVEDLVKKTISPCRKAVKSANLKVDDIDEVILVGGSTRMPCIQNAVEGFFKKTPSKGVNPDEVVAMGASIQGGVLAGDVNDVLLLDVTPLSLGIETMGGIMTKLIESNTTIPTSKSQVFSTAMDNQPSVDIHVLQGERPLSSDNRTLGRFQLTNLPPSPRGIPQIEVTFDIDANGIINVSAKDKATDKIQNIRIESGNGLSDEEIERMKKDSLENEESDNKKKSEIEKLNEVDSMIFQTEKQIKEFGDKLSDTDKDNLNDSLNKLKSSYEEKDFNSIDDNLNSLNETWSSISTKLYENNQENDSNQSDSLDEDIDVNDVEFEEVKTH